MKRDVLTVVLAAGLAILGGVAQAEKLGNYEIQSAKSAPTDSPYGFAKSGKKAARDAEAETSGAKVIGGEVAAPGAWPWQVALIIGDGPVTTDTQFCGGSLVLDTWVLTAAHCVHMADDKGNFSDLAPDELTVLAGTNRLDGTGDQIKVEKVFRHPSYSGDQFDYDIALIKLTRAPNVPYKTVTVPDADFGSVLNQPGITTVVTGWGIQNGGKSSTDLRQAQIQMLDRDMCNTAMLEARAEEAAKGFSYAVDVFALKEDDAYAIWDELVGKAPKPLSENMICSGTFEGGKTSCNGDSGGPLVVPLEDGTYIQAGIVSWGLTAASGHGCEENAMFSAYTDVSHFVSWLNEVVAANP
ncbi:MAG: serine protease [Paracoccaceae bacterium]